MKKILFALALSMQLQSALVAQLDSSSEPLVYNNKKTIGRSEVKINAMRDFTTRFGHIENAAWSRTEEGLRAKFIKDGVMHMVDYDKKGRWVSTIDVYDEMQMKSDLRRLVKSIYIDYLIVKVIEVKIGKSHVHFVKLENSSSLLTLHIMNGEITEMENYRKG